MSISWPSQRGAYSTSIFSNSSSMAPFSHSFSLGFLSPVPNDPWSMHELYAHTQFRFWSKFWNFKDSLTWVSVVWLRTREGQRKLRNSDLQMKEKWNWKMRFSAWNPVTSSLSRLWENSWVGRFSRKRERKLGIEWVNYSLEVLFGC